MGMAASQARYIQLTARKANCEYEGQQINQARTNLANEVAGLFNKLLDLDLPEVPSTSDYTTEQYSYSDGTNEYAIDNYYQLSSYNSDYNYAVTSYCYADIYTGSKKTLTDPQVQAAASYSGYSNTPSSVTKNSDNSYTVQNSDGTSASYSSVSSITDDISEELENFKSALGNSSLSDDSIVAYNDGSTWHFALTEELDNVANGTTDSYNDYAEAVFPTYVGNSSVSELTSLSEDQVAELSQIVQDVTDSNISNYFTLNDDGTYSYTGSGIYTFSLNGSTYYTTYDDLMNSYNNPYSSDSPIDNQSSLAYYNAAYLSTKISNTNNALIETDDSGLFTSIRFEGDSATYSLNYETVTDDAAYEEAMNQYNYAVQVYQKTINDINAKTSAIQKEDQQLELELEQLDTEQNAIATEMESVKKVIDDSIETIFNTFQS